MDRLENGWDKNDYHRINKNKLSGLNVHDGSNVDTLLNLLDNNSFTTIQRLEEQDKAHAIDYAHGLELDDLGDNISINRNDTDDTTYRFYLKAHNLIKNSKGTFPDLINIASKLLGCDKKDVRLVETQHINDDKSTTGKPSTIQVKNQDITKIKNSNLIPLLETEMQKAAAGSEKIEQIDFSLSENVKINLGLGLGLIYQFNI